MGGYPERAVVEQVTADATLRQAYLDLLKRMLTRTGFEEPYRLAPRVWHASGRGRALTAIQAVLEPRGYRLVKRIDDPRRSDGSWPVNAETMIGMARLDNLQWCLETAIADGVPGDVIETGVWRGGACILARGVLRAHNTADRRVWVADSFQGLPPPDPQYNADVGAEFHLDPQLAVSLEDVRENFARYGLLDDQVGFLEGWFKNTLPSAPIERLAVARLDGDMYESTMDALTALYPKVSAGGFLIVDDYEITACRRAVADYRDANQIGDPIERVDDCAVFWRKGSPDVQGADPYQDD